jgi:YD repeat-containing protein
MGRDILGKSRRFRNHLEDFRHSNPPFWYEDVVARTDPIFIIFGDFRGAISGGTRAPKSRAPKCHQSGRLSTIIHPDPDGVEGEKLPPVTYYDYTGDNQLSAFSDSRGFRESVEYDALNRRTKTLQPDSDLNPNIVSDGPLGRPQWLVKYDAAGNVVSTTDPNDRHMVYQYDALNLMKSEEHYASSASGGTTLLAKSTFTYDTRGNLASEVNPRGYESGNTAAAFTTRYTYDLADRRLTVDRPDTDSGVQTHIASMAYDKVGNIISSTDELGRVTSYTYDALNRQVAVTDPSPAHQRRLSTTVYDAVGNVVRTVDALGNTDRYVYDNLNRQIKSIDPRRKFTDAAGSYTVNTSYDTRGLVTKVVDARGVTTEYDYNQRGFLMADKLLVASGTYDSRTYQYDAAGNLTQKIDRNNRKTIYQYDYLNRLSVERWYCCRQHAGDRLRPAVLVRL